jgi:hypothetical protein
VHRQRREPRTLRALPLLIIVLCGLYRVAVCEADLREAAACRSGRTQVAVLKRRTSDDCVPQWKDTGSCIGAKDFRRLRAAVEGHR